MCDHEKFKQINLLIIKMNKIMINVEAMKNFNQWRLSRGESPGYSEHDFFCEAENLDAITQAMEKL